MCEMNVYDFDKTIFGKDSTLSFYFFCLRKRPGCLRYLPRQLLFFLKYIFGLIDKTRFKEGFFSFLRGIRDVDTMVTRYWEANERGIRAFYREVHREDDVVVSASPYFLLAPICQRLGITRLIASQVDPGTGAFSGENCYGEEKVTRFLAEYPQARIHAFYSDSLSDAPLAILAEEAYVVKGEERIPWDAYRPSFTSRMKKVFFTPEFFAFLLIGVINAVNGVLFASLFSFLMDPNLAFVVGYLVSLTISYLLNSLLAFHASLSLGRYVKFCVSYLPNFLIQNGLVFLFYNLLGLNRFLVYTIAVIIAIPITFLMLRFFAFSKSKKKGLP